MATVQTLTLYPSGYVSDDYSYASISNVGNGYTASSSTTYARINLKTGSSAETYLYYTFDTPNIPDDAVICEVVCTAKARISNQTTSRISSRTVQLYSSSTAKGSSANLTTSASELSLTAGDWTIDELRNLRLKLYAKRGTSLTSSSYYIRFYGATLIIKYVIPETIPIVGNNTIGGVSKTIAGGYCNVGGTWKDIVKSYANVNGVWIPTWKQREISFTWKKYTVITDTVYKLWWVQEDEAFTSNSQWTDSERYSEFVGKKIYSTYSFDPKTEKITLSGYLGTVGDFDSVMSYIPKVNDCVYLNKYDENNTPYSMYGLQNASSGSDVFNVIHGSSNGETTETYGTYIEDVTSSSYTAYPENGKHTDGYWYIRQ